MKYSLFFFLSIILSACTGNIEIHKSIPHELITDSKKGGYAIIKASAKGTEVPNRFIGSLTDNVQQHLSELSLYRKKDGILKVNIQIIDYNIKGQATRAVMGSLAGVDDVRSKIQVININTNQVIGESTISTSSSMAYGQKGIAWVHADDIVRFLSTPN